MNLHKYLLNPAVGLSISQVWVITILFLLLVAIAIVVIIVIAVRLIAKARLAGKSDNDQGDKK